MPIKFRCSYCRQFLGISRGRAGGVVDCPTCGRSIRVPGLDGSVQPVPTPELNVRDAKLIRALDELANWHAPLPAAAVQDAEEEPEEEIPQPIAEPIPIEVPLPPEPISVHASPVVAIPQRAEPAEPTNGQDVSTAPTADAALSVAAAISELNQIAVAEPNVQHFDVQPPVRHTSPRFFGGIVVAASLLFLIVGVGGGYWAATTMSQRRTTHETAPEVNPTESPPESLPAVTGRITYKTADGSTLPDRQARVLVLPREREGTLKLSPVGFRAADDPADVRLATAAVKSLGGDFTQADDGGNYQVHLPNPGTFHLVVLSNYSPRRESDEVDPELVRVLAPYFEQSANLVGRTKAYFDQVRYKGGAAEIRDHTF